jgi:hypothetical protein
VCSSDLEVVRIMLFVTLWFVLDSKDCPHLMCKEPKYHLHFILKMDYQ